MNNSKDDDGHDRTDEMTATVEATDTHLSGYSPSMDVSINVSSIAKGLTRTNLDIKAHTNNPNEDIKAISIRVAESYKILNNNLKDAGFQPESQTYVPEKSE